MEARGADTQVLRRFPPQARLIGNCLGFRCAKLVFFFTNRKGVNRVGQRRKARILALQLLYQVDLIQDELEASMSLLWGGTEASDAAHHTAEERARGVRNHLEEIDRLIQTCSDHWRIDRMAVVDRNILRLAVYELIYHPEIPEPVILNEAIELGKRFGTEESGAFINGVLDQIRLNLHPLEARG
jgi:N utilization substance protein B